MGEALDFKFGQYIHRVHLNKSPLNFGEKGAWAYPGTVQILGAPLLSQERVKPKIFRALIYRTHCAVIFAIAQLSCPIG